MIDVQSEELENYMKDIQRKGWWKKYKKYNQNCDVSVYLQRVLLFEEFEFKVALGVSPQFFSI